MSIAEIGRQIRALRTASGRTVASVAVDAGLSVPYIANLENGRGNPTAGALSQLASALGMRLVISLVPDGDGAGARPQDVAEMPRSLVRLGRSARFRDTVRLMAGGLDVEPDEFAPRLIGVLAQLARALECDPGQAGWWRILDALLLIASFPCPDRQPDAEKRDRRLPAPE